MCTVLGRRERLAKNPARNKSHNKLFISLPTATEIPHLYLFHDNNKPSLKTQGGRSAQYLQRSRDDERG